MNKDVTEEQLGTFNMQNFDLLKEVGRISKPVILKRGLSATISEWLMAAGTVTVCWWRHTLILAKHGAMLIKHSIHKNLKT